MGDREIVLARLREDLIGPRRLDEILKSRPSDVYLTGILWPRDVAAGGEADDRLEVGAAAGGGPEGAADDATPQTLTRKPCSAGVSFALHGGGETFEVAIKYGLYSLPEEGEQVGEQREGAAAGKTWTRAEHSYSKVLPSKSGTYSEGLPQGVEINVRAVAWGKARLVTATIVNAISHDRDEGRDALESKTMFQVAMQIRPGSGAQIVARPSRNSVVDEDDRVASVIYRSAKEYATGHTSSAYWHADGASASEVGIAWIPEAVVHSVSADGHECFAKLRQDQAIRPLSAEWLADADDSSLCIAAARLVESYREWIALQRKKIPRLPSELQRQAEENVAQCEAVAQRMDAGVSALRGDRLAATAFRLANQVMAVQFSWDPERAGKKLAWRPFQLAFVLLSLESVIKRGTREESDRGVMDLLWFPTGGGKTEAYLALVAFLSFYRRMRFGEAGVTALMRYTLRLLTTQQFARAAAVMLACEAVRRGTIAGRPGDQPLGEVPFSIGLWVGSDATPNSFDDADASLSGDDSKSSPKQLALCPACGQQLRWSAVKRDQRVEARCLTTQCVLHFNGDPLPIHTVDSDVYRERPTLLIGTVDKFAQLARREDVNRLFGIDNKTPPDLIIQDELHLISGPLGTVAGVYEAALDLMFECAGHSVKIIGSTATIRRASEQVGALFHRRTCQFPPPAIDYDDSGFAVIDRAAPGRLYAAVTTVGRSAKFTLQAASASLLQSTSAAFSDDTRRDPYWTLVAYFNSLRELGGALVLMQDDVDDAIDLYSAARSENPRKVLGVEELTSRRTQQEILEMLSLLKEKVSGGMALDVVLATNMVSVGVDIPRLGLMLVNGQPKGTAEYIQATSRVGRGAVPGLVVSVLNNGKARDRSRFETFPSWHSTLYRDVEATSVTPFAPRARDRALHAAVVGVVRNLVSGMLTRPNLDDSKRADVSALLDRIAARAKEIDPEETEVRQELSKIARAWNKRMPRHYWQSRQPNQSLLQDAERAAALRAQGREPGEAWPTMNNMRSIEPSTPFRMANGLAVGGGTQQGDQEEQDDGNNW